jgi:hypothetical protein
VLLGRSVDGLRLAYDRAGSGRAALAAAGPAWAARVEDFFSDVEARPLPGVGHFWPLEPEAFAAAIRERL